MLASRGRLAVNGLPVIVITSSARITRRELARSIAMAAAGSSFSKRSNSAFNPIVANSSSNDARTTGSVSGKFRSSKIALMYSPVPPTTMTSLPRLWISLTALRACS